MVYQETFGRDFGDKGTSSSSSALGKLVETYLRSGVGFLIISWEGL
jgi:hypothetical protein